MKLRARMLSFIIVLIIIVMLGTSISYIALENNQKRMNFISDQLFELESLTEKLIVNMTMSQIEMMIAAALRDEKKIRLSSDYALNFHTVYHELIDHINNNFEESTRIKLLELLYNTRQHYRDLFAELVTAAGLLAENRLVEGSEKVLEVAMITNKMTLLVDSLKDDVKVLLDSAVIGINKSSNRILFLMFVIFSGSLLLLIVNIFNVKYIVNTINKILGLTDALAKGDLRYKLDIKSKDELGNLANNFNLAVDSLRSFSSTVKDSVSESANMKETVSGNTQDTQISLDQMSDSVTKVTFKTGELDNHLKKSSHATKEIMDGISLLLEQITTQSTSIEELTKGVEEMVSSIVNVARITEKRQNGAAGLIQITGLGMEQMELTTVKIQSIADNVGDMLEAAELIDTISMQTNLLSMNAAIAAAHAGDAGKGFAVVADEIRKLSELTAENSNSIGETLKKTVSEIQELLTLSGTSSDSLTEIKTGVNEVTNSLSEISSSMSELSNGAENIGGGLETICDTTFAVRERAGEMNLKVVEINSYTVSIKGASDEVLDSAKEIDNRISGINTSMNSLQCSVGMLMGKIDTLHNETKNLKVEL